MSTLFDLFLGKPKKKPAPKRITRKAPRSTKQTKRKAEYEALVAELTAKYKLNVKRWRKNTSGVAWTMRSRTGVITNWIESPYPTGPVSCAVFLHEVGHHAIGLGVYRPRCLEEHMAWQWALKTMRERGLNITDSVKRRVERSMQYAVSKAVRRGLKRLPVELQQYL